MAAPIPAPYVRCYLHGGPHHGDSIEAPWARMAIPMLHWEGDAPIESTYRLSAPWRGQDTAHYTWAA